jgi:hypothetical protein
MAPRRLSAAVAMLPGLLGHDRSQAQHHDQAEPADPSPHLPAPPVVREIPAHWVSLETSTALWVETTLPISVGTIAYTIVLADPETLEESLRWLLVEIDGSRQTDQVGPSAESRLLRDPIEM